MLPLLHVLWGFNQPAMQKLSASQAAVESTSGRQSYHQHTLLHNKMLIFPDRGVTFHQNPNKMGYVVPKSGTVCKLSATPSNT